MYNSYEVNSHISNLIVFSYYLPRCLDDDLQCRLQSTIVQATLKIILHAFFVAWNITDMTEVVQKSKSTREIEMRTTTGGIDVLRVQSTTTRATGRTSEMTAGWTAWRGTWSPEEGAVCAGCILSTIAGLTDMSVISIIVETEHFDFCICFKIYFSLDSIARKRWLERRSSSKTEPTTTTRRDIKIIYKLINFVFKKIAKIIVLLSAWGSRQSELYPSSETPKEDVSSFYIEPFISSYLEIPKPLNSNHSLVDEATIWWHIISWSVKEEVTFAHQWDEKG